jgi:DNA-binding XRE family transcriptional regulator
MDYLAHAEATTDTDGLTPDEASAAVLDSYFAFTENRASRRPQRGRTVQGARTTAARRPHARRRRETRRSSNRAGPDDPDGEHEPARGRSQSPGGVVKRLRIERGLTQNQAAAAAGLIQATWSQIETGLVSEPRPRTRAEIAEVLGVKVSDIWPVVR